MQILYKRQDIKKSLKIIMENLATPGKAIDDMAEIDQLKLKRKTNVDREIIDNSSKNAL